MVKALCPGCKNKTERITRDPTLITVHTKKGQQIGILCGTCPDCPHKICTIITNQQSSSKKESKSKIINNLFH